jgi:hypothetical protein
VSTELKDAPSDFVAADFPQTDSAGDVFDPELHAAKPDGTPATRTDGTFRKKRRDAGRGRVGATRTSTRSKSTSAGGTSASASKLLAEQHARHAQAIKDGAGIPLMVLSFTSPVDAYSLSELVDPFANALATVAQDTPQLAAALDKVGGLGGWATVAALLGVAAVQVMHNHDRIPEDIARMVGAKPKREIEKILQQRGEAMRAARQQAGGAADAA